MSQPPAAADLGPTPAEDRPPRHGFQGDRGAAPPVRSVPAGLTVAVSRESGSRGGTIACRVARKLGWQIYDQELLEYMAQEVAVRQGVLEGLQGPAGAWVEERMDRLLREQNLSQHPLVGDLARVVLSLGAQGGVVLIGRGSGSILPRETTLNVRIVAPQAERVAYMSQWMRLTQEEAAERVASRDRMRNEFVATHFHRHPGDIHKYDLVLNTSLLGEDVCAELIAQAARAREAQLAGPAGG